MADDSKLICSNRDCRVFEKRQCVEGLDLSTCPHFGRQPDEDDTELAVEGATPGVKLPPAEVLDFAAASRLLRSRFAKVIAIIGPKGSGKTSLIASLYDLLQEGPVGGAEFARSETLHAFELACHDARSASRRGEPDMERTPLGEAKFYHIDISGGFAESGVALLLADRAGEEYRAAADDAAGITQFPEISRADTVTILVDGQRLLDIGARHNLKSEITMILQALKDGKALRDNQRLLLVLTKFDVISGSKNQARAQADFASLLSSISEHFQSQFGSIDSCIVCASPKTANVSRGTGVPEMLKLWTRPELAIPMAHPTDTPSARAFSRYLISQSSERSRV